MKDFKPMLAYGLCENELDNLQYPLILQPKLDGIRCCILNGKAVSRKLKPIPNRHVREKLETFTNSLPILLDGELVLKGDKTFNEIQSAIMSEHGEPDFNYIIFDTINDWNMSYMDRILKKQLYLRSFIQYLNSTYIYDKKDLLEWEQATLEDNFEGIILRSPSGLYKFGRSTLREQILMKFKRFSDSEAIILSSNALLSNCNNLELDELGYSKRSSAQDNLVAENKLGSWTVKDCNPESRFYNQVFNVGTGFTELQRVRFWLLQNEQKEKIIKYKYQAHGSKDKPRSPVWIGFRED